jgi:hypothetical protein
MKQMTAAQPYPTKTYTECGNAGLTNFLGYSKCVYTKNGPT